MDLAEAAHKARMRIGLGDEQLDVDDLGRMDDRPRQAAAQSPGGVDRWGSSECQSARARRCNCLNAAMVYAPVPPWSTAVVTPE